MIGFLSSPFSGYEDLRAGLESLVEYAQGPVKPFYIDWVRHLVWFIALGIVLTNLIEAFFYPFFLVFILGLLGVRERIKNDRRVPYFALIGVGALMVLYMYVLRSQTMSTRFLALFLIPSFVFLGFGLEKIWTFFRSRFSLKESVVFPLIFALILASGLPKVLKARETDKAVFKQIGTLIAEREGNDTEILVATSPQSVRWISFYANVKFKGAPCPKKNYDLETMLGGSYAEFVKNLRARGIRYFLWEEKHWPRQSADYLSIGNPSDFIVIGAWTHPDTGKLMLFEVNH